jgi:hypothetical protein
MPHPSAYPHRKEPRAANRSPGSKPKNQITTTTKLPDQNGGGRENKRHSTKDALAK